MIFGLLIFWFFLPFFWMNFCSDLRRREGESAGEKKEGDFFELEVIQFRFDIFLVFVWC